MTQVITRFAPSPTGFLHIGGARTAMFNWLYARHHGGKFMLRVEDTDQARSTKEAIDAIFDSLRWLGLDWDGKTVFQSEQVQRHQDIAQTMLEKGRAYNCFVSAEELQAAREEAQKKNQVFRFRSPWRDKDPSEAPDDMPYVVRLKAPLEGEMVIEDQVQGSVRVAYSELDDMVLLRSDGTPTYMLAVVVDDHDMGVTHVIRGDDHLNNSFRQQLIYDAMGWPAPQVAHIPLIHGADGAKLSKRHGALGTEAYRDMGILPEAMFNYLLRLGWSHGDDEIISREQAIEWFDLDHVGKSPARFDLDKLKHLNAHYIRESSAEDLLEQILPALSEHYEAGEIQKNVLIVALEESKERAKTLLDLEQHASFFLTPMERSEKAKKVLSEGGADVVAQVADRLEALEAWESGAIEAVIKDFVKDNDLKMGKVGMPVRAALGATEQPNSIWLIMALLGKTESLARLRFQMSDDR